MIIISTANGIMLISYVCKFVFRSNDKERRRKEGFIHIVCGQMQHVARYSNGFVCVRDLRLVNTKVCAQESIRMSFHLNCLTKCSNWIAFPSNSLKKSNKNLIKCVYVCVCVPVLLLCYVYFQLCSFNDVQYFHILIKYKTFLLKSIFVVLVFFWCAMTICSNVHSIRYRQCVPLVCANGR